MSIFLLYQFINVKWSGQGISSFDDIAFERKIMRLLNVIKYWYKKSLTMLL